MRPSAALAVLVGARCAIEAVAFAALAATAHVLTTGRAALPIVPATLMLFGAGLVLASLMREIGSERRGVLLLVATAVAGAVCGLALPARAPDGLAVLSRVVFFGLLAEAFLWRLLSVARGATRWVDTRNALPLAAGAVAAAAFVPGPVDRDPLAALSLVLMVVWGLALSLARSTEEVALAVGTRGTPRASAPIGASLAIGVTSVVAALALPALQRLLDDAAALVAPAAARLLYLLILPFAYVAAYLVDLLRPILASLRIGQILPPGATMPEQDEELLRSLAASRPIVFGVAELLLVLVAALVGVVLLDRLLRERRLQLAEGVTLEREDAAGLSLAATLRSLLPRRGASRRAPRDDGTPGAALRLVYWRFLALAERKGPGWRAPGETPDEHLARLLTADRGWSEGSAIVRAFEDLRYGERSPDPDTVDGARAALRALEDARRAS